MDDDQDRAAEQGPETLSVVLSFRVYPHTKNELDQMAKEQRRKYTDVARILVEDATDAWRRERGQ